MSLKEDSQAANQPLIRLTNCINYKTHLVSPWISLEFSSFRRKRNSYDRPTMQRLRNSFTTTDLVDDLLCGSGPDERFWLFVVLSKIFLDGGDEFFYVNKVAAPQALLSEFAKPTLDQVKPRGTGGGVMHMKARMLDQPLGNVVMLMGAVIVQYQVQVQTAGDLSIKLAQELQIFLMSMTRHTRTDHGAVQHVESGKESRRAVPLIVVRHGAATTLLNRQPWLRSFQSLNLALLIHTQYQRFIGWIQVQAHHVVKLFDELFIFRELEVAAAMWLQPIGVPNTLDRRRTDAVHLRHCPHTPMCRRFGSRMQSCLHDFLDLGGRDLPGTTPTRSIINQRRRACIRETVAPQNHCGSTCFQFLSDPIVGHASGCCQHDSRTENYFLRTVTSSDPGLQNLPLLFGNCQCFTGIPHGDPQHTAVESHCKDIYETLH